MRNKIIFLFVLLLGVLSVKAQQDGVLKLSAEQSITDHIDIQTSRGDNVGMIVKILFLEDENAVSVSLISYHTIFALWSDTRYRSAVNWFSWLIPHKLPFANECDEKARFKISSSTKKDMKRYTKRRRKYVMRQTLRATGAFPLETPTKIVNDVIEQKFLINGDTTSHISIFLGDILFMEKRKPKKEKYHIFAYSKLDKEYKIAIERDHCLSREGDIEVATTAFNALQSSLASLNEIKSNTSISNTVEKKELFDKLKEIAVKRFPKNLKEDKCDAIRDLYIRYNALVDSLQNIRLAVEVKSNIADDKYIRDRTRQLDQCMSVMQCSTDVAECLQMKKECEDIISEVNLYITSVEIIDDKTVRAVEMFYNAEKVFINLTKYKK
ncbi:hypothetical protein [Parabacteroides sp.]